MSRALLTIADAARSALAWAAFPFMLGAFALIVAAQEAFGRD